ncbi:MAG TPA: GGDEF domain-containing protein, partial [Methylomicrobium sp.]|nr:GGDEF domain-containing protein [Methylomicrobium sp.]
MPGSKLGDHLESLFEYAPISLWEEDYSAIKLFFDNLRAQGVVNLERYLGEHPEELDNNIHRIKVKRVNRETLCMFGATSREELLANLDRIFRDEMQTHFRSELSALWNGEVSWSGEGINYRLNGEALNIRLHWRILPGYTSTWERVLVSIENITELKQAENQYQLLFEYAPISLWEADYSALKVEFDDLRAQGITDIRAYLSSHPGAVDHFRSMIHVLDVNRRTLQLFDADDKKILLTNLNKVFRSDMREFFADELVDLWNGKTYYERNGISYSLSGEPVHIHLHWTLMPGYENDFGWVLVALQDVTERKKAEDYLRYLGTHDVMTGVYSRAYFEEAIQKLEMKCENPISFIVVDLDELKTTNDTFGHNAGDKLIRRAAEVLKASIEEEYTVARIGGDEFIIIMPGADSEAANMIVERVQSLVSVNNKYYREPLLSLSLGAATSAPGLSLEKTISLADDAMYQNKGKYHHRRWEDRA